MAYYSIKRQAVDALKSYFDAEDANRPGDLQILRLWDREKEPESRRIEVGVQELAADVPAGETSKKRWNVQAFIRAITSAAAHTQEQHEQLCAYIEAHVMRADLAAQLTAAQANFRCIRAVPGASNDEMDEHDMVTDYLINLLCIVEAT